MTGKHDFDTIFAPGAEPPCAAFTVRAKLEHWKAKLDKIFPGSVGAHRSTPYMQSRYRDHEWIRVLDPDAACGASFVRYEPRPGAVKTYRFEDGRAGIYVDVPLPE